MTKSHSLLFLLLLVFLSCKKEDPVVEEIFVDVIKGYVQKGPYLNGTSIQVTERSTDFIPTGKTYSSQLGNKGSFELQGISLSS